MNLVYISVFVKETRGNRRHFRYAANQQEGEIHSDLGGYDSERENLFNLSHLKNVFETSFKQRPNNMRIVLLMLLAAMILNESVFSK